MQKLLNKALKDAVKEKQLVLGIKQVASAASSSSLVILSNRTDTKLETIEKTAQEANVPVLKFNGTSVSLGKMCGLQFRVSALSLTNGNSSIVQSIIRENE
ncbi:MAG: 50S ribosomal protein L7ae [Cenarchaeum sp. SB0678_bin_8]|nr:50S ribosomal protein L7ae [Cenarchaeum sp. SB0666_bin_15]MYD58928.1 50S ribosomal protein L7ae [Cenarchaeum sp. SB0678_bin_8]MYJ27389.1 50S ribosomal protein L7ae [Cenarchaeum sp. SB0672_bin_9]